MGVVHHREQNRRAPQPCGQGLPDPYCETVSVQTHDLFDATGTVNREFRNLRLASNASRGRAWLPTERLHLGSDRWVIG